MCQLGNDVSGIEKAVSYGRMPSPLVAGLGVSRKLAGLHTLFAFVSKLISIETLVSIRTTAFLFSFLYLGIWNNMLLHVLHSCL